MNLKLQLQILLHLQIQQPALLKVTENTEEELSLLQRCASHLASKVDIDEAFKAGRTAVKAAVRGVTDKMVAYERVEGKEYKIKYKMANLSLAANTEKTVPIEWINKEGNYVTDEFIDYCLPLIQGETKMQYKNGLPRFANLKKEQAGKR